MRLTLFILFSISVYIGYSQEPYPCETDQINSELFKNSPALQEKIIQSKNELEAFTESFVQQASSDRSDATYIIPVVFHIIHDYGLGNISDAQIHDGLRLVNEQFRKLNADTVDIVNDFKHLASDTKIEFRLAQLDPDGNCTNGINRIFSPLTNAGGHVIKDLIQWPPNQYLNIWVANVVGTNLAGHCIMPPVADTIPEWDGIAIQHSYVGSIGTSTPHKRTVLTHEIGHYLNLYHIWGGNNVPGFYYLPVGDASNCDHDDGVADTPNTIGWSSCNLTASSCGSALDMVQNYMDYSYCSLLFTEGQKQRMHATLNSPVAKRNNLWTESNLIATGILGASQLCKVNIEASERIICTNESVTFTDISYNGVTSREWTFIGGDITTSPDSTVTVSYSTPGIYNVKLSVSNSTASIDSTFTDFIRVIDNQNNDTIFHEDFESEADFNNRWFINPLGNPISFERINYGKNSDYSIYVDNYNGPDAAEYSIFTLPIDASQMTSLGVSLDYAYAKASTSVNEKVYVQLSKDCGKSWITRKQISLYNNFSVESDDPFFPTQEDWIHVEESVNITNYNVEDLMIRFAFSANKGNNLFIDNVNISDISQLNINKFSLNQELRAYPNPAKEHLNIEIKDALLDGEIQLLDIYGKLISTISVQNSAHIQIDLSKYSAGSYFINYIPKNNSSWYKLIKIVVD